MWLDEQLTPLAASLVPLAWLGLYSVGRRLGESRAAAFMFASVTWGVLVTVLAELLSLIGHLDPTGAVVGWSVVALGSWSAAMLFRGRPQGAHPTAGDLGQPPAFGSTALWVAVSLVAAVLAVAALRAPVTSWDALGYHMPRVLYWAQYASVEHYPTADVRQLFMAPWSAYLQLHLILLAGSDRLANLVQWAAMAGSALAGVALARDLGARPGTLVAAAALVVSIPMGIQQATSSMIDYVVAFWCLVFAHFAFRSSPAESRATVPFGLLAGAAMGLAVLSKGTAIPILAPFGVVLALRLLGSQQRRKWLAMAAVIVTVIVLNAAHSARNLSTFGHPRAPENHRRLLLNQSFEPRFFASNLVRHSFAHLGTWDPRHAQVLTNISDRFHEWIGVQDGDLRHSYSEQKLLIKAAARDENLTGNLFHLIVSMLCGVALLFVRGRNPRLVAYCSCLLVSALLFCLLVKYQISISRLHVPLFVLAAPWAAAVLDRLLPQRAVLCVAGLSLVLALPWVFFSEFRPLLGPNSIFNQTREDLGFFWLQNDRPAHEAIGKLVQARDIETLGLIADAFRLEYQLWRTIRRNRKQMPTIQNLVAEDWETAPLAVAPRAAEAPPLIVGFTWEVSAPEEITALGSPYRRLPKSPWSPYSVFTRLEPPRRP